MRALTVTPGRAHAAEIRPDVVIETTGVSSVVFDVMAHTAAYELLCLVGVAPGGHPVAVDAGDTNRDLVLGNAVVLGSVNANRRHYNAATAALTAADPGWLDRLISRRVPLDRFADALTTCPDDIKVVVTLQ